MKPSLLFIHRSVGQNLLDDSDFYALPDVNSAPYTLSDFNQNTGTLTSSGQAPKHTKWVFPGGDTTPEDYDRLFSTERLASNDATLQEILSYDIIAIKSCFPNTRITSDKMLASHQQAYEHIVHFFQTRAGKKLIILTSPPLVPVLTLPPFAKRARRLAAWLSGAGFGANIFVFDLFNELAAPEGAQQANMLRAEYRRRFPFDSHPNAKAAMDVVPKLATFFARVA